MSDKPMKRNAKPRPNSPIDFVRLFLEKSNGTDIPIKGNANAAISTLKPKRAMTHAVNVVPTLAPIITAIDCANVINPAFTKLTTMTVEAEELCIKAVMKKPVMVPVARLRVMAPRMLRRRSPAAFCKPSLITFIP